MSVKCVNARIIKVVMREAHGIVLSLRTVYKYLVKLKLSRKRVRTRGTSKKDVPELIAAYKRSYSEALMQGKILVSVDECGFSERTRAIFGYSPVGAPCIVKTKGSWQSHSLLMAVFSTGEKRYFVFKGAVCKASFEAFINSMGLDARHVVLADNASIHKGLKLANSSATILYTPPYEPDSNPIELCFSQVKRVFREMNTGLDTDVLDLVGESVERAVTPSQVMGCFDHVLSRYVQA
jgi:transposase